MITKETNVKTKQKESRNPGIEYRLFPILYNILTWHAIRFVEHDAIRAFQDSLFACLIFHAKGVLSLCLCRLDARACNIPKPGSSAVTIEIIPRMQ